MFFMLKELNLCKDEVLYKLGDPVDGMYLIKEGEIKYYKNMDYCKPELLGT